MAEFRLPFTAPQLGAAARRRGGGGAGFEPRSSPSHLKSVILFAHFSIKELELAHSKR